MGNLTKEEKQRCKKIIRTLDYWTSPDNAEKKGQQLFYMHTTQGVTLSMVQQELKKIFEELKKICFR